MSEDREIVFGMVRRAAADAGTFIKMVLSGDRRNRVDKTTLEAVKAAGEIKYRVSMRDANGETSRVISQDRIEETVGELLESPFRHLHILTAAGETHIRISKKGRYLVSRGKGRNRERVDVRGLNRAKQRLIDVGDSRKLLSALGMVSKGDTIKAGMYPKFRQVNRFIELLSALPIISNRGEGAMNILDCGCGKAYLTFALYHYLRNLKDRDVAVTGVDHNDTLITECIKLRNRLKYDGLDFIASEVSRFEPVKRPDLVLSLHACDMATDEAIAKGINMGAPAIVAVPCCQHELHHEIESDMMKPVLRHGILRERTAEILTDAFRALVLRAVGYKADVIEFIDPEATSKNVMIRAHMARVPSGAGYAREFRALCDFWGIRPGILDMLDDNHKTKLFPKGV